VGGRAVSAYARKRRRVSHTQHLLSAGYHAASRVCAFVNTAILRASWFSCPSNYSAHPLPGTIVRLARRRVGLGRPVFRRVLLATQQGIPRGAGMDSPGRRWAAADRWPFLAHGCLFWDRRPSSTLCPYTDVCGPGADNAHQPQLATDIVGMDCISRFLATDAVASNAPYSAADNGFGATVLEASVVYPGAGTITASPRRTLSRGRLHIMIDR